MVEQVTFNEINQKTDRRVILFGSGNIAEKTLRNIPAEEVAFIADNSENLQGGEYKGLRIKSPEAIRSDDFVIITSTAITDISGQLNSLGLEEQSDFVVSPVLNDRIAISELEQIQTEFYFTSGAVSGTEKYGKHGNNKYAGGLFRCTIDGLDYEYEQVYEGPSYGTILQDDRILFIDTDHGIMSYRNDEVSHLAELPDESRAHGLSFNSATGKYYVACSYRDSVLELNENFSIERELMISSKIEQSGEAMHHCNDCLAVENSLYVTMFSSSGNWKRDSFDGCLAEFDLESGDRLRDVRSDFWMPHNIDLINGSLHVLDSLSGELRYNNLTVQASFPGFSRGLDYENGLYFIGQSKNRNHSKVLGDSKTVSIDCGVKLYDPELSITRFLHFHDVGGIHSVVIP